MLQAKEEELVEDVGNMATREEEREEYDQYNDDPTFNNRQREYYNQRYIHILLQLLKYLLSDLEE